MKKEKPFKTEIDLCARFLSGVKDDWVPYPETAGWDILLARRADGFQIGVQAKLRLNVDVVSQALEDFYDVARGAPDCRAVLVPYNETGGLDRIAAYTGLTVIRVHAPREYERAYHDIFTPALPRLDDHGWINRDWYENAPLQRCKLPEYVPDVAAGASAPIQLTTWKIAAIKIAVTLEVRGFVTRADFKHLGIDHRRWLEPGHRWLRIEEGRYVAGDRIADFKAQHPRVYEEIKTDAEKWMLPHLELAKPAKQESLLK